MRMESFKILMVVRLQQIKIQRSLNEQFVHRKNGKKELKKQLAGKKQKEQQEQDAEERGESNRVYTSSRLLLQIGLGFFI